MGREYCLQKYVLLNWCALKNIITVLCSVLILLQLSCKKQPSSQVTQSETASSSEPKPPDLSNCTRVEMKFLPSTKDFIRPPFSTYDLFDTQETEYLESIDKLVLKDPKAIKVLSEDISSSIYKGTVIGIPGIENYIIFTCYNNNESLISFLYFPRKMIFV